jgi:hypothetical protein
MASAAASVRSTNDRAGGSMTDELVDISYWLPITTVNLTGSIVTVRGKTDETIYKTQATPVVVTVFTRRDYDVACRLRD